MTRICNSFAFLSSGFALLLSAVLWRDLPTSLPVHFSLEGTPNLYAPKELVVCLLPAASLLSIWMIPYFIRRNSSGFNPTLISQMIFSFSIPMNGIYLGILLGTILSNDRYTVISINLCLGILLICFGGLFRKVGRNFVLGIRTPWALASEDNWIQVHQISSRLMIGCGALLLFFSVFLTTFKLAVILILTSVLGPMLYTQFQIWKVKR